MLTRRSGGKLYYGVFGDTDGDDPEEIGEASWLMANTCFPGQGLNGGQGHGDADVTCMFVLAVLQMIKR